MSPSSHATLGLGLLLALGGCTTDAVVSPTAAPAPSAPVTAAPPAELPLFDEHGRLLPSELRVAGLTLPRGLRERPAPRREYVYETDVPVDKVLAYFGPRLFTPHVDRVGHGAIYRQAKPLEERGVALSLDVSVLPTSHGGSRIHIHDLPPPPIEGEALRRAREAGYAALE